MRGTRRSVLATALSVLAACGLLGSGCQAPSQSPMSPTFGGGGGPGLGDMGSSPALSRATDGGTQAAVLGGVALGAPVALTTTDEPAAVPAIKPVVWRASSHGLTDDGPARQRSLWRASPHVQETPATPATPVPSPSPATQVTQVTPVSHEAPNVWDKAAVPPLSLRLAHKPPPGPVSSDLPKELDKVAMPPYRIEPPDILLIDVFRVVPRPPYRIEPSDELLIQASEKDVFLKEPINGIYPVDAEGYVDLAFTYGKVQVTGLTVDEANQKIRREISARTSIKEPRLTVAMARTRGYQQVRGEHLVRPDGTVSLGVYGEVAVAGKTLDEAKAAVRARLARKLLDPEVTVDVAVYNSKVYYVIFDGGGLGQQITRLPVVGGETVLDALAQVNGIPAGASDKRIWIARPVPGCAGFRQVLPVDWQAITEGAATNTNYQLFPGDRIFVKADHWIAFNNRINKLLSPFERMFGFTLLGNAAVRAVGGQQGGLGGGIGGGF